LPRRIIAVLAVTTLTLFAALVGSVQAAGVSRACGESPYSYAGIIGWHATRGIMATVEVTTGPQIVHGHVAAWVGVGGVGSGPGGTNEWLQVGLAATESATTRIYYELAEPHAIPRFVTLHGEVAVGQHHRVGVIEVIRRPNWWRIWLDGAPVTQPIHLRSSHNHWAPVATSESWNGGVPSCNAFCYRFMNVRSASAGHETWRPLTNAYRIDAPG
jgi:hypothetical protein